ncbi:amidohydrolase [Nesterenkonia suensis]
MIITARSIRTMDPDLPTATALVLHGGRITWVGDAEHADEVARRHCRGAQLPDSHGFDDAVIVPGFVDPHAHPLMYGQMLGWVDCGPSAARSIPEILSLLQATAAEQPPENPVRGYGYEQKNLVEGRHPTRDELDLVATDRPVYLMNASGHGGVVNSWLLEACGIDDSTPDPPGGTFFRDPYGRLTGEVSDAACNALTGIDGVKIGNHGPNFHLADSPEQHLAQFHEAQQQFLRRGVTTIGDAQVSRREFETYLRAAEGGTLLTRLNLYLLSHLLDNALEIGLTAAFGTAHLTVTGVKLYADGTLGGSTAYFPEGYADDPCRHGQLYHSPEEYTALVSRAHAAGLQTATHAQSPAALAMVLQAIREAQEEFPRADPRHRIEHCGLPTAEQIDQMASLGIIPVNQTQHYYNWGDGLLQTVGPDAARFNPLGEFQAAGVPYALSSDAPVAAPDPLAAIETAVTRQTRSGAVHGSQDLRVDVADALEAHTIRAAHAVGRESDLGSLKPGKRADFVVLDADPLTAPESRIATIEVRQTWIDGRPVWKDLS